MKLLFFVQMLKPDDTIRGFILNWAQALAKEVTELVVISQETYQFKLGENVRVYSLGKEEQAPKWKQFLNLQKILQQEHRRKPIDAILTHMTPIYTIAVAPQAGLLGIPLFTWYTHSYISLSLRLANFLSKKCFTASDKSFRLKSKKKTVIGHGIDLDHFQRHQNHLTSSSGPLRLVTASRLSPVKRIEILLQALEDLPENWALNVAGEAPMGSQKAYEQKLKNLVENLKPQASWMGPVPYPQMPSFLQKSDVYVNLSNTGSIDKGVLEAIATGLTVLTGNEAFFDFLGETRERTFLETVTPQAVREKLLQLAQLPRQQLQEDQDFLYSKLKEQHSLGQLAHRLVTQMKACL